MDISSSGDGGFGLEYWLQWPVLVTALILILATAVAINILRRSGGGGGLKPADLWAPCWRNLHPRWLLLYRAFSFLVMAFFLYQTVAAFGFVVFLFYTQWTFALVMIYFALATIVSIRGCRIHALKPMAKPGEKDKFLNNASNGTAEKKQKRAATKLEVNLNSTPDEQLQFLDKLLQILYQTCAGASMLTDIVFWCLLLPLMSSGNFELTLLIGVMHSVNAVFLIIESALNRMPFNWIGLIYFLLWSCMYVVFQWGIHACCVKWWPYPFFDPSPPVAPLWYLGLGLFHVPFYGFYVWLNKAKQSAFSRMFPMAFVRFSTENKQD